MYRDGKNERANLTTSRLDLQSDHEGLARAHACRGDHRVQSTSTSATNDAIVPLLAPRWAPTVADCPVLLALIFTEANYRHTVVETLRVAQDLPWVGHTS